MWDWNSEFYPSLERLRNSLGFWYSEFSHISFGIRFKVQNCPDSLICPELIFSSTPQLSVIIIPEPLVGWGRICSFWKGLKILYHFCIVQFSWFCTVFNELGTDLRITQLGWGLCREPFFSGAVNLFKSIDDSAKGCYMWTTWDTYGPGPYTDWAWKACGVLVGFSPTGCTSIRITWLSDMINHLFVVVIT
jgi:hypothetical protein